MKHCSIRRKGDGRWSLILTDAAMEELASMVHLEMGSGRKSEDPERAAAAFELWKKLLARRG